MIEAEKTPLNNSEKALNDALNHLIQSEMTKKYPTLSTTFNFKVDMVKENKLLPIIEEPLVIDCSLLRKYYDKWREVTRLNRKVKTVNEIKEEQIDKFIHGLKAKRKEKLNSDRSTSSSTTTQKTKTNSSEIYQNRYKAQRDIILMQKSKLIEQEKRIHELQYGKICEELKDSYNDSQNTIKDLLRKFSTKTKITHGVKVVEEPEEVQMKINKVPKLVKMMEQRAQDREIKRKIIQERKRLIDEEKKRLFEEQLEKKRIQDEEEKKMALEAIKVRRRRELEEEKRKQAEREKYQRKCKLADKFYMKILKRRSILAFRKIIEQKLYNENISIAFFETMLMKKLLNQWRINAKERLHQRMELVREYYKMNLKRKYFNCFLLICVRAKQNMQVAIDYHAYQIQCKVFKEYYLIVNYVKIRRKRLMNTAIQHYKTRLLVQAFYQWKSLPAILQLERAKEEKKKKWREKVLQIVPDYKPPELF